MYPPAGYQEQPQEARGGKEITSPSSDGMRDMPQFPVPPSDQAKDNDSVITSDTSHSAGVAGAPSDVPDFDELSARFEALKKKS